MELNNSAPFETTVELPLAEVEAALRSIEARVDNPGVGTPQQPGETPGPEIENPSQTEAEPQQSDIGPESRAQRWN